MLKRSLHVERRYVEPEIRYKQRRYGGGIFDVAREDIDAVPRLTTTANRIIEETNTFRGYESRPEQYEYIRQFTIKLRDKVSSLPLSLSHKCNGRRSHFFRTKSLRTYVLASNLTFGGQDSLT